jgi:hypothetical protein
MSDNQDYPANVAIVEPAGDIPLPLIADAAIALNASPAPVSTDGEISDLRRIVANLQMEVSALSEYIEKIKSVFLGKI